MEAYFFLKGTGMVGITGTEGSWWGQADTIPPSAPGAKIPKHLKMLG